MALKFFRKERAITVGRVKRDNIFYLVVLRTSLICCEENNWCRKWDGLWSRSLEGMDVFDKIEGSAYPTYRKCHCVPHQTHWRSPCSRTSMRALIAPSFEMGGLAHRNHLKYMRRTVIRHDLWRCKFKHIRIMYDYHNWESSLKSKPWKRHGAARYSVHRSDVYCCSRTYCLIQWDAVQFVAQTRKGKEERKEGSILSDEIYTSGPLCVSKSQ